MGVVVCVCLCTCVCVCVCVYARGIFRGCIFHSLCSGASVMIGGGDRDNRGGEGTTEEERGQQRRGGDMGNRGGEGTTGVGGGQGKQRRGGDSIGG